MARIDLTIPSLGNKFVDLRETIPGDSFNWSWVRPLSQINYLAIHHTAASDTQTPREIANFHIQSNGWGGIGYHFIISKDGTVYYVGDISTARANVANLNEQVIGICLVGNFTDREPANEQIDSARILCDFFINNYPNLPNVNSWDCVMGHKELPGQSTACPGNTWLTWKAKITVGSTTGSTSGGGTTPTTPDVNSKREEDIADVYRKVLGREPDAGGLQTYATSPLSVDEILKSMVNSEEHKRLLSLARDAGNLTAQVENLQTSLTLVNEQLINLQQNIQEKDQEIIGLKEKISTPSPKPKDNTLTIFQALFNLYKFVFMPGKEAPI